MRVPLSFGPVDRDGVLFDRVVGRDEDKVVVDRLRYEQPVKGVVMVVWEVGDGQSMFVADRQGAQLAHTERFRHKFLRPGRQVQLAEPPLDSYFPAAGGGKIELVLGVVKQLPGLRTKARRTGKSPEPDVSVEQKVHG